MSISKSLARDEVKTSVGPCVVRRMCTTNPHKKTHSSISNFRFTLAERQIHLAENKKFGLLKAFLLQTTPFDIFHVRVFVQFGPVVRVGGTLGRQFIPNW